MHFEKEKKYINNSWSNLSKSTTIWWVFPWIEVRNGDAAHSETLHTHLFLSIQAIEPNFRILFPTGSRALIAPFLYYIRAPAGKRARWFCNGFTLQSSKRATKSINQSSQIFNETFIENWIENSRRHVIVPLFYGHTIWFTPAINWNGFACAIFSFIYCISEMQKQDLELRG